MENLRIHYDGDSNATAELLVNTLSEAAERILHFFQLEQLSEKVDIIIYSTIDAYNKHVNDYGQTYYEWMIADTFDGKINIKTIDICRKSNAHRNMSFEDYAKVIIHEFVHICQQQVNPDCYGCEWF